MSYRFAGSYFFGIIPLLAVPVLLCGARGAEPQPVPIVTPSPVPVVEATQPVAVPDCKTVDPVPKPQPEQGERYPGVDLSGITEPEREIVTYLLDRDVSLEAACGILSNINRETGGTYAPCITNPIGATGLSQWLGNRLFNLCQCDDWDTVTGQLDFLLHELETSESGTDLHRPRPIGAGILREPHGIKKCRPGTANRDDTKYKHTICTLTQAKGKCKCL